jgi:hypothetical protein
VFRVSFPIFLASPQAAAGLNPEPLNLNLMDVSTAPVKIFLCGLIFSYYLIRINRQSERTTAF